jgi:hypothetical protein
LALQLTVVTAAMLQVLLQGLCLGLLLLHWVHVVVLLLLVDCQLELQFRQV